MTTNYPVFPIQNQSACVYKWTWSTLILYTGTSSSCHRVHPVRVGIDDFDSFHNTDAVIADRVSMATGQWPGRGCEYCKDLEQAGTVSDRTYHNAIPNLTPLDFTLDAAAPVTPRILEVYLHNTCDLACVYCTPKFSSKINAELKKFGPDVLNQQAITIDSSRDQYYDKFLSWLDNNGDKLLRLSLLGGEPLLQREFWSLMEFLQQHKFSNLELSINTNLNCNQATMERFVDMAKQLLTNRQLKRVDVSCSLDNWSKPAEFIRYGLDLTNWQRNFEYLIQHKWLYLNVHHVITSLSMSTALELQQMIAGYKQVNKSIVQAYHLVDEPAATIYHPGIFGAEFFSQIMSQLVHEYPITHEWDHTAKTRLESIAKMLESSTIDYARLTKLKAALVDIDARRGTDWKLVFPEIDNFFIKHKI